MLFNSFEFLFCFLPLTAVVFFFIAARGFHRSAIAWLVLASLFFYGWWNPAYLVLIAGSIAFNYAIGVLLAAGRARERPARPLLALGVGGNLLALGYFKYANFFVDNLGFLFGGTLEIADIVLPLAISFFTFQQIAFLVDAYSGKTREYSFLHYCLFVTFFPQLIAGPIVHHKEMLPQFAKRALYRLDLNDLAAGVTLIVIGLFKKAVIADTVALYSDPVFAAAADGAAVSFIEAWAAALAYTAQIYFDFSGYVDMAMGAARIFGIRLPINFHSPYKALNIADFWRRWHITLSRFLRDYLYVPLGGNRKGQARRYANLMIVMLLGGLWHGAGWTFVFWGFLHGVYLSINHGWRTLMYSKGARETATASWTGFASWAVTFIAVVVAWVFFRAENFPGAWTIVAAMFGHDFTVLPESLGGRLGGMERLLLANGFSFDARLIIEARAWLIGLPAIALALFVALALPNSNELFDPARRERFLVWQPNALVASLVFCMFAAALVNLFKVSPFLYFNF